MDRHGGALLGSAEFSSQIQEVERRTRRITDSSSTLRLCLAIFSLALSFIFYGTAAPPPPKICGTLHGPPVTAPRIRLPDGRPLAYYESGAPLQNARYKVIVVHNYGSSGSNALESFPDAEKLGAYLLSYDRAGYGESHPFPHRSVESEISDIEFLANELSLGPKFHVVAFGFGAYAAWGCIKHLPHRLNGVAMIDPVANFWWPGLPAAHASESLSKLNTSERWLVRVAHYAPQLLYWWTRQKWVPSSEILELSQTSLSIQQGVHESLHRDLIVQFGRWKLDPTRLPQPRNHFPAQVWFREDNPFFPPRLQNYLERSLTWIQFHSLKSGQKDERDKQRILSALIAVPKGR